MMHKRSICIRGDKCVPLTFKARLNCVVTHNPILTSHEIADRAEIQHGRLMSYASESQPGDHIPFKALLRLCDALHRWDLIDAELNRYHIGIIEFDAKASADALNESIDVNTTAARVLEEVRTLGRDGSLDALDRAKVRELLRTVRAEVEQLDAALDAPAPKLRAL